MRKEIEVVFELGDGYWVTFFYLRMSRVYTAEVFELFLLARGCTNES